MIRRKIKPLIKNSFERGKSILLLGPRQTGKTTLLKEFSADLSLNLSSSSERLRYEADPSLIQREIRAMKRERRLPLIFIDEIQKVPALMNELQDLIDNKEAQFLLTGSSARKLRKSKDINWLPGRIHLFHLDPISILESEPRSLEEALLDGSLPGIMMVSNLQDRANDLQSYVETYLEEEIRSEGIVRQLGPFSRFLELAAIESGNIVNYSNISNEIGVSGPTVKDYFEILFDCLVAEKIEPITKSISRKKLTKSPKILFFDLGVRRVAAREGRRMIPSRLGQLFEQWVGLELLRIAHQSFPDAKLRFWRDPDGPEVDWIWDSTHTLVPIEVKWSDRPHGADAKNLEIFLDEYPESKHGFIISRSPRPYQISKRVTVLPWQELPRICEGD